MTKEVPLLLKKQDQEVEDLLDMAITYLGAYAETRDFEYLPTIEHCIGKLKFLHMRRTYNGPRSSAE